MKLGRNYQLVIHPPGEEALVISPPFSLSAQVNRSVMSSTNECSLELFNLAPATRAKLHKDRYTFTEYWGMQLSVGYDRLYEIFRGNIREAWSSKQGTEWITRIEAFDGEHALQNGHVSMTVAAGTEQPSVIQQVVKTMPNLLMGFLGVPAKKDPPPRGQVLLGPSGEVLSDLTDGQYFVDGETVNVLSQQEVIAQEVYLLDADRLFSSPRRKAQVLEVETLISPEIRVGYLCELRSRERIYDGQYKVLGINHTVLVSGASAGQSQSLVSLYSGAAALEVVE